MQAETTDFTQLMATPSLDMASIAVLQDPALGGDPDFLVEVVDAYQADTPARIEAIQAALASADGDALSRAAHSLKGSSGYVGARRLQAICAEIERLARANDLADLSSLVARLQREYEQVAMRLAALTDEAGASLQPLG